MSTISKMSTPQRQAEAAALKVKKLKDLPRYFVLAMMAGVFVGFAVILSNSITAPFAAAEHAYVGKLLMGLSFGVALSLVVFTGTELFTSNTMVMVHGLLKKRTTWKDLALIFAVSWLGNLAGSLLLAYAMKLSGLLEGPAFLSQIVHLAQSKMAPTFVELFFRGILCNILVCLAIFTSNRTDNDAAKLMLIFWCLFAFISSSFEHSIANMTLMPMALLGEHPETVNLAGFIKNLSAVTLGNIVGGSVIMGLGFGFAEKDVVHEPDSTRI